MRLKNKDASIVYGTYLGNSAFLIHFLIPQLKKYGLIINKYTEGSRYRFGILDHTAYNLTSLKKLCENFPWIALTYKQNGKEELDLLQKGVISILKLPLQVSYIARVIKNIVRHTSFKENNSSLLLFADNLGENKPALIKKDKTCLLIYKDNYCRLTPREHDLCKVIFDRVKKGIYFIDYSTLLYNLNVTRSSLRIIVCNLRKKLAITKVPISIKNEYGLGYRIVTYWD